MADNILKKSSTLSKDKKKKRPSIKEINKELTEKQKEIVI